MHDANTAAFSMLSKTLALSDIQGMGAISGYVGLVDQLTNMIIIIIIILHIYIYTLHLQLFTMGLLVPSAYISLVCAVH